MSAHRFHFFHVHFFHVHDFEKASLADSTQVRASARAKETQPINPNRWYKEDEKKKKKKENSPLITHSLKFSLVLRVGLQSQRSSENKLSHCRTKA